MCNQYVFILIDDCLQIKYTSRILTIVHIILFNIDRPLDYMSVYLGKCRTHDCYHIHKGKI